MLQKFLSYFGNPIYTLLGDGKHGEQYLAKDKDLSKSIQSIMSLEDCLLFNKSHPLRLDFTPNGNYGDLVKVGDKKFGIRKTVNHGNAPYFHAFFFDFDIKDFIGRGINNHDDLWKRICNTGNIIQFRFSFVAKTPGGFHCYTVFKPSDIGVIHTKFEKEVLLMNKYFISLFDSDANAFNLAKTMRVPTSLHRKTGEGLPTELYQCTATRELLDQFDENSFLEVSYEQLSRFVERNKSLGKYLSRFDKMSDQLTFNDKSKDDINEIPFDLVLEHLKQYPRFHKGKIQSFSIDGDVVVIGDTVGNSYRPDGYKYWKEKNIIKNFSVQNHDHGERPCGQVLTFLCWYFGEKTKVSEFLMQEFGITVNGMGYNMEGEIQHQHYRYQNYVLYFTNQRVTLETTIDSGGTANKKLFGTGLSIVAKAEAEKPTISSVSQKEIVGYIFKKGDENIFITRSSTKNDFNRKSLDNLFFYGNDNDLGLFFEILDSLDLPVHKCINYNGYYSDCLYVGGKMLIGEEDTTVQNNIVTNYSYNMTDGEQMSAKEYLELLSTQYIPEVAVPAFCAGLALAGMNLWDSQILNPALLITGIRGSGKSSLKNCIANSIGLPHGSRSYSIGTCTKQPLCIAALDAGVLCIDELTGFIPTDREQLIRNIVNRDSFGSGMLGHKNIEGMFRAPLLVTGERMFFSESINNRFVVVPMSASCCIGTKQGVTNLEKKVTCHQNVYTHYFQNQGNAQAEFQKAIEMLAKQEITGRLGDVWAYVLFANNFFNLGYSEKEIILMIDHLITKSGLKNIVAQRDPTKEFFNLVVQAQMKRQLFISYTSTETIFTFEQDFLNKNMLYINEFGALWNNKCDGLVTMDQMGVIVDHSLEGQYSKQLMKAVEAVVTMLGGTLRANKYR